MNVTILFFLAEFFRTFFAPAKTSYVHLEKNSLISLSGKRVFDIAGIRVSEISVYYENRRVVPMLGKDLCTIHFAKA